MTRPNPFALWLPMYAPGAVPERPWWRSVGLCRWERVDGRVVTVHGPGIVLLDALDAADAKAPLPAPSPMVGQVWVSEPEQWKVEGFDLEGNPWRLSAATEQSSESWANALTTWPPLGAVLVAGPTPWGRDVPWAPPGWKP